MLLRTGGCLEALWSMPISTGDCECTLPALGLYSRLNQIRNGLENSSMPPFVSPRSASGSKRAMCLSDRWFFLDALMTVLKRLAWLLPKATEKLCKSLHRLRHASQRSSITPIPDIALHAGIDTRRRHGQCT